MKKHLFSAFLLSAVLFVSSGLMADEASDQTDNLSFPALEELESMKMEISGFTGSVKADDGSLLGHGPVFKGEKNGIWTYFHKGTQKKLYTGSYKKGQKYGFWTCLNEEGNPVFKSSYSADVLNGTSITYFRNGIFSSQVEYKAGLVHGRLREYYSNGNPREISGYRNGLRDGQTNLYYEDGTKKLIGNYSEGKKSGKWTFYREDGRIESQGTYKDDEKTGLWTCFDENNNKTTEQH